MKHAARLRRLDVTLEALRPRAAFPPILLQRPDGTLAAHGGEVYPDRAAAVLAWPDRPGVPPLCIIRLVTAADLAALRPA